MRDVYWLVGILAAWRLTHLLHAEDGPWDVIVRLRRRARSLGGLMDCFYCLSLWVAAPLALAIGDGWLERALLWPAFSAGAILAERLTASHDVPATWTEDEERDDGVLREAADMDGPAPRGRRLVTRP